MAHRLRIFALAALAPALAACATATPKLSVVGRPVEVRPNDKSGVPAGKGELIAVGPERLWVLEKDAVREIALRDVEQVKVRRHGLGAKAAATWAILGALLTGGALAGACSSVEGHDNCGGVFTAVALTWAVFGGLAVRSLDRSSQLRVRSPSWEDLRPYARFPQGLPEGLDLEALARARPEAAPSGH